MYLRYLDILDPKDIETAFRTAAKGRADALLVLGNPILNNHAELMTELRALGITAPVRNFDHHLCHNASAYFASGFDPNHFSQ